MSGRYVSIILVINVLRESYVRDKFVGAGFSVVAGYVALAAGHSQHSTVSQCLKLSFSLIQIFVALDPALLALVLYIVSYNAAGNTFQFICCNVKGEVMRCSRYGNGDRMHAILNDEFLEEVDCFKYLGSQVAADGGCERDVINRMNEGYRAWGALKSVLSNRGLGIKTKNCVHEGVIVPTALYGAEVWGMRSAERRKVNVLEMKCL